MYTHSPDPSTQYAILRKIRGSRDQAIPGYFAPQEQIPWERGCLTVSSGKNGQTDHRAKSFFCVELHAQSNINSKCMHGLNACMD
jgi:hypothetical protein